MRNRIIALVAVPAAVLGLTLAAAGAANASVPHVSKPAVVRTHGVKPDATSVCGFQCVDVSNYGLGSSLLENAYSHGGTLPIPGRALNLRQGSNSYTNEDFEGGFVGFLGEFCANQVSPVTGLPGNGQIPDTSYACLNYPSTWDVFQLQYSPDSNQTGYCTGASRPVNGVAVTLIPCGEAAATYWVGDRGHSATNGDCRLGAACPWVNAADPASTQPMVLTANRNSRNPKNRLTVTRELTSGGVVPDIQQFVITAGPFD